MLMYFFLILYHDGNILIIFFSSPCYNITYDKIRYLFIKVICRLNIISSLKYSQFVTLTSSGAVSWLTTRDRMMAGSKRNSIRKVSFSRSHVDRNLTYMRQMVMQEDRMKMIFIVVLYGEMNRRKRSRYRVVKTMANSIWDFPERPVKTQFQK